MGSSAQVLRAQAYMTEALQQEAVVGKNFEGMDHAVFWIAPDDLEARHFGRAVVQMMACEDESIVRLMWIPSTNKWRLLWVGARGPVKADPT